MLHVETWMMLLDQLALYPLPIFRIVRRNAGEIESVELSPKFAGVLLMLNNSDAAIVRLGTKTEGE